MTEANQRRLYEHFKSLLENPNPRKLKGVNEKFVKEQAQRCIDQMTKDKLVRETPNGPVVQEPRYKHFVESNSKKSKSNEAE